MIYWRICWTEGDTQYSTVPISDPGTVSEIYKSVDQHIIETDENLWVEAAEVEWKRLG